MWFALVNPEMLAAAAPRLTLPAGEPHGADAPADR